VAWNGNQTLDARFNQLGNKEHPSVKRSCSKKSLFRRISLTRSNSASYCPAVNDGEINIVSSASGCSSSSSSSSSDSSSNRREKLQTWRDSVSACTYFHGASSFQIDGRRLKHYIYTVHTNCRIMAVRFQCQGRASHGYLAFVVTQLICRVVNIAVLVSLPILSAILLEYWHDYRRYFLSVVSKWVSAILFQPSFGNTRYQYFSQQAMPLRLLHNDARGTTTRVSARTHAVRPRCTV